MEQLLQLDRSLFKLLNSQWHNAFFDAVFPYLRIAEFWGPLYLFLIIFSVRNFGYKGWLWVLFLLLTVTLTDMVSSRLIKENITRLRPCNNPLYADWIRVLVAYRPQSSSFTSSHAANHFGVAMFVFATYSKVFKKWPALFFVWALLICYAQVYVGVHYPLDIAGGTVVGCLTGYITASFFNRKFQLKPHYTL
ncbi:MAG TPA: phosphatase PAP2 family protein [Ferruginibacter sp.]|nr:phosphatase PAP2 family protein [Ferruginibacter sp.]HMP19508.1 phosphatase PAP2 family protein [Ferruginibacter sp.]